MKLFKFHSFFIYLFILGLFPQTNIDKCHIFSWEILYGCVLSCISLNSKEICHLISGGGDRLYVCLNHMLDCIVNSSYDLLFFKKENMLKTMSKPVCGIQRPHSFRRFHYICSSNSRNIYVRQKKKLRNTF